MRSRIIGKQFPGPFLAIEQSDGDRLHLLRASVVPEQLMASVAGVAQQPEHVRPGTWRTGCVERLLTIDARVDNHSADFGHGQTEIAIRMENVLAWAGGENVELGFVGVGGLGGSHFGVVEQTIAFLPVGVEKK